MQTKIKRKIQKAETAVLDFTKRAKNLTQPKKRVRKSPGTKGTGNFYRIEVRPKGEFKTFRVQDVGSKGGLERVAGKRGTGTWDTVAWLVSKKDANVIKGKLIITGRKAKTLLQSLSSPIEHVKGDIFKSSDRKNIAERLKPTSKMRVAQSNNIRKAQLARSRR